MGGCCHAAKPSPTCRCWQSIPPPPPNTTHTHTLTPPLNSLDAAKHDLGPYLSLLTTDGRLVLVGLPEELLQVNAFSLAGGEWCFQGAVLCCAVLPCCSVGAWGLAECGAPLPGVKRAGRSRAGRVIAPGGFGAPCAPLQYSKR